MQIRPLGKSNLRVSSLCLGTMMFGDQTDATESANIVAQARDQGVNFIDTADVYTQGESERITGQLIQPDRDRWVLATKLGNPMGRAPNQGHYSRKWVLQACEDSLRRLQTDYIDIYYLHRDHPDTDFDELLHALGDLVRSGKIRYWAVSNYRGWRIAEIVNRARVLGVPAPIACQPYYNLLNRMPEVEILPACEHFGLGVVPYSPIARGVLTGKYVPGAAPPPDTRAGRGDKRMHQTEFRSESLAIAQTLKEYAAGRGTSVSRLAVAWVLAHRAVSSVIAGPRTLAQWQDYLPALEITITPEDEAMVDRLVAPGHPSTPGFTDPSYPLPPRRRT